MIMFFKCTDDTSCLEMDTKKKTLRFSDGDRWSQRDHRNAFKVTLMQLNDVSYEARQDGYKPIIVL